MENPKLIQSLTNTAASDKSEAMEVIELHEAYPYCQALQALAAKVAQDFKLTQAQALLQSAAVYATDRSLLKEIMIHAPQVTKSEVAPVAVDAPVQKATINAEPGEVFSQKSIGDSDLAEMLLRDMEALSKSRHHFEELFGDNPIVFPEVVTPEPQAEPVTITAVSTAESEITESDTVKKKEKTDLKTRRARMIELARAAGGGVVKTAHGAGESRKKKKENPVDELIEEIQENKEVLPLESEKQKEQIELIDNFIRSAPSIATFKDKLPAQLNDLNSVKSGEFGENIVSETLVEILVKQGKKDRAVEVLKKLIWKYPQKKAYFASQIEDLKK